MTASFTQAPEVHDGSSAFDLQLEFSHEPAAGFSYRTVEGALFDIEGGRVARVWRRESGKNRLWGITITPDGNGAVTVAARETTDCTADHAVCDADGRKFDGELHLTVRRSARLAVADATVEEAEGATLDFVVTLGRARSEATTIDYATSDGTARAGEDYTATSGTLTFEAEETSKTVSVTVHDDAHDEGNETMTLTLSNPSGAQLEDATAIGTIENSDPMPRAWMVRFGRTVGSQVVDALTQRLDGGGGSHVTVAGINVVGAPGVEPEPEPDDPFGLPEWAAKAGREADSHDITGDDILLRSAFHLSSAGEGAGTSPALTAWGRVATGGFEAEEDGVTMDGDVTTGLVGFDAEWERLLAGVMLSQSEGEGSYRLDAALGTDGARWRARSRASTPTQGPTSAPVCRPGRSLERAQES